MAIKEVDKTVNKDGLSFIREVAKYFMDFLETDFHKRKSPKRGIQFRSSNNLLVGLNLNKYPSFNSIIWKTINHSFDKSSINTIPKGAYRTNIPKNLLDLVRLRIGKVTNKQILEVISIIADEIEKASVLYKKEYDQALNRSLEASVKIIKEKLVLPFINSIEKPLENLDLGDENHIYIMEEELTMVLSSLLENKISEIIKFLIAEEKIDVSKQLKEVFDLSDIKNSVLSFFDNLQIGDLFAEVYEMERNRTILDKQEFYLYFCDITFNNAKFPIFYIPFNIQKQNDSLGIEFDSQVYINKKALEYITQEYNKERGNKGQLKSTAERIVYLAQHQGDFPDVVSGILSEITNFFGLDSDINISDSGQQIAKSLLIRASNSCYISLFDKSDEALVNDYEEILELLTDGDNVLAEAFNKLIADFIHNNPKPVNPIIEEEWDDTKINDRLVFNSPIPLNSEQLQILSAIRKDDCKYMIVEGPPGTGKSHTITAIVFDSILKNQSVLVLSDKKEALDVVEDKITETMNKVRCDRDFQNPILRLGKTGNTYSQILATTAVENIKTHYRAVKKDHSDLKNDIEKLSNTLKEDLEAEILAYKEISLQEIHELFDLESYYFDNGFPIDVNEVLKQPESAIELDEFRAIFLSLKSRFSFSRDDKEVEAGVFDLLNLSIDEFKDIANVQDYVWLLESLISLITKIKESYISDISLLSMFDSFSDESFEKLEKFIADCENEKSWLFGYLFKKEKIETLDRELRNFLHPISQVDPHNNLSDFKKILDIYHFAKDRKKQIDDKYKIDFDYLKFIHQALTNEAVLGVLNDLIQVRDDLKFLNDNLLKYPITMQKLGINPLLFKTLLLNKLVDISDLDFNRLFRFINLSQKIKKNFDDVPTLNYAGQKKDIESLVTAQMTFLLDGRLIDFYENNKATAKALRDIIRTKRRFPKNEFLKLKEAFPCILAGIRDYAEYIPLEPNIFDLVIIDEASQVSIAQAFPALLRAKKILILGDKKQFSNVKTTQARTDTNREYLNNLRDSFIKNISNEGTKIVKLEKFNIKTSILEFFEFITNYNTQLLKHFRGYKEIISYSNKYFYQDSLQVMKIRGKSISDVIKFSFVKYDGKKELVQNTNIPEAEFIISELKKLKEDDSNQSVGIITPHTNQQKTLVELINKLPEKDYFYDKLKLKIMTFDTCQGEERDTIFYSMVATKEDDHLWGVFIKDLNSIDIEEDGKIKAQRLNVGLSRAKETMHFILSKPIDEYNGSIGEALRHYYLILEEAKKEKDINETDKKSKMEPEVMNWFYQTDFWKKHKDDIEFLPQFELGKYLKQLDKTYNHPKYKVDFLLVYKDETHKEYKIIIEYDGFREHFNDIDEINEFNYQDYYTDNDVYRQKVLESYGYKFLRVNKFNIGDNPIQTLNNRIEALVKGGVEKSNIISHIHSTVEGLQNGEMKECPKCKEIRDYKDFRDPDLVTGYGRFCMYCKGYTLVEKSADSDYDSDKKDSGGKVCPRCGSEMVLRRGRYGKFYGCSKFPYCREITRY
jgi:very-short-patch-repair endonuclease